MYLAGLDPCVRVHARAVGPTHSISKVGIGSYCQHAAGVGLTLKRAPIGDVLSVLNAGFGVGAFRTYIMIPPTVQQ